MKSDTIAAIATGMTDSGIGIVRISGEDAVMIVDKIYRSKLGKSCFRDFKSHTIHYGYIVNKGKIIDEVMVSLMISPNSYTAEDTVEINCHGGVLMVKKILETVIENGARLAEPGEFTKRAFLNGRIEGIHTVIIGKPNAGKSSFLNLLVGEEKAIVTDIAGTTRDVLEESISLNGIQLNIIDTAGIRFTEDTVEKIGVEKARKFAKEADLIVYVVDVSVPLDESDYDIIHMISDKKFIILLNKTDLPVLATENMVRDEIKKRCEKNVLPEVRFIKTSMKENEGIDVFEETIKELFFHGEILLNDEVVITNMRHKEAVMDAYESMLQVKESLENNMPEDFYSIDLMSCYESLGRIIGEEIGEDLMNEIFSQFCMGK